MTKSRDAVGAAEPPRSATPLGTFCLVLHTHLPWVARHGAWPVGEEWLHQAWAMSYQPLRAMLEDLAREGRRDVLTLGLTPVVSAMLDDPYCLRQQHTWLGDWQARALGMSSTADPERRAEAARQYADATARLGDFEDHWSRGGSAAWRPLVDAGVIEVLGGPLTHSFTPILPTSLAGATLRAGLDDAALRRGTRPRGIWAPECAYAPGLEKAYAAEGVDHVVVDGPTLLSVGASPGRAWRLGDSEVVVVGRDLPVSYRVWSPRRGYPGGAWYRDFHAFDHEWGFRSRRVTGVRVEPGDKRPYEPDRAARAIADDVDDFVRVVVQRLREVREESDGRAGLVVAAYDTELFGHWWFEGPQWLGQVLRALPEAGVRVATLGTATSDGTLVDSTLPVHPQASSWGSGKDWSVWTGPAVADLAERQRSLTAATTLVLDQTHPRTARSAPHDQLIRELLLALSSDWAFMVSKDTAAQYARERFDGHARWVEALSKALREGHLDRAAALAARAREADGPFGHLDARRFLSAGGSAAPILP